MQSADDVELGDRLAVARTCSLESFVESHGIGSGRVFLASERAQAARGDANIGGIDVAVDVEIGFIAVPTLTHMVRHPARGEDVAGAVQGECVVNTEPLAAKDLGMDRLK